MCTRKLAPYFLLFVILFTALACQTISGNDGQTEVQPTVAPIENADDPMLSTAQVSEDDNPDLTQPEQAPEIMSTVYAFATENPEAYQTMEALGTEQPDLQITVGAAATQMAEGVLPPDIPLPPHEVVEDLASFEDMVTFQTSMTFQDVLNFYQVAMLESGWTEVSDQSMVMDNMAMINYTRSDREASLAITYNAVDDKVAVVITVATK